MRSLIALSAVFAAAASAQQPQLNYVDALIQKVKPESAPAYEALVKKMADANRKNKGANWIASTVMYGEQSVYYFTSGLPNMAAIDENNTAFERAIKAALGEAGMIKLFTDSSRHVISSRGELRRIRADLSGNANPPVVLKSLGQSRYVRTIMVRVRPGRNVDYENQLKMIPPPAAGTVRLISVAAAGQQGAMYYSTTFGKSMAEFDTPPLATALGTNYASFLKMSAENVLSAEVMISRYLPHLSNPPQAVVDADPQFWAPKPPPPPAKPKPTGAGAQN